MESQTITRTGQTNLGATNDEAESTPCDVDTSNGVWYKLSVAASAYIAVSTCLPGTDFDTMIAIYSGASCGSFICKASADDTDTEGCNGATDVDANVEASDIYIYVTGFDGDSGTFDLEVSVTIVAVSCC